MPDCKQLCFELTEALCGYEVTDEDIALIDRARAAMSQPEPKRLTVQQISNLPQHRENYIAEGLDGVSLDGYFSRADLQQLADSIPSDWSNSNA